MTDRYLFRGKRINGGKWVIGHLAIWYDGRSEIWGYENNNELYRFIIDPATIGQCSGLRDKNGKMIYESDIVDIHECGRIPVVFKSGCFGGEQCDMGFAPFLDSIWGCGGEIIGNIYDNPELLSEGAE